MYKIIILFLGFRKRGFYYTEKDYLKNTFELEDIFDNDTIKDLQDPVSYKEEFLKLLQILVQRYWAGSERSSKSTGILCYNSDELLPIAPKRPKK